MWKQDISQVKTETSPRQYIYGESHTFSFFNKRMSLALPFAFAWRSLPGRWTPNLLSRMAVLECFMARQISVGETQGVLGNTEIVRGRDEHEQRVFSLFLYKLALKALINKSDKEKKLAKEESGAKYVLEEINLLLEEKVRTLCKITPVIYAWKRS